MSSPSRTVRTRSVQIVTDVQSLNGATLWQALHGEELAQGESEDPSAQPQIQIQIAVWEVRYKTTMTHIWKARDMFFLPLFIVRRNETKDDKGAVDFES